MGMGWRRGRGRRGSWWRRRRRWSWISCEPGRLHIPPCSPDGRPAIWLARLLDVCTLSCITSGTLPHLLTMHLKAQRPMYPATAHLSSPQVHPHRIPHPSLDLLHCSQLAQPFSTPDLHPLVIPHWIQRFFSAKLLFSLAGSISLIVVETA